MSNVNTASSSLLQYLSGLSSQIAKNIIAYREENGAIKHNKELSKIKHLGAKTFEQSIGFLRIVATGHSRIIHQFIPKAIK